MKIILRVEGGIGEGKTFVIDQVINVLKLHFALVEVEDRQYRNAVETCNIEVKK